MRTLPVLAVAALAAATTSACGSGGTGPRPASLLPSAAVTTAAPARSVTATAVGMAEGTPDLLTVTVGVQTHAGQATAALADNNARASAVINALKAGGVADKDVQTSQLSINPTYTVGQNPVITGYDVTDMVTARLRNLAAAGTVIDDAARAAGDAARIQGITFSISDDSALLAQARADAVHQATARAKAMADAAGVGLGEVRTISDLSVQQPLPQQYAALAANSAAGASPVPLQPGSEQLSVQVQVVYDIA